MFTPRMTFPRSLRPSLAALALTLAAGTATAQEEPDAPLRSGPFFGFVVEGAAEFGGDAVATILFEDGSTQEVKGGQGVTAAVGGEVRTAYDSPLSLRGTVGFKYVTTKADNAHITLTRVPVELVASYELPNGVRFGGGFVRHMAVKFSGDDIGPDLELDDANGGTVEVGWKWVALTFTAMQYTGANGEDYDASNIGASFSYTFGRR
jgi:hypothetical protein